ncbi:MAG: hypothetical protein ABIA04_05195 [Pseudomonadota bacterium]
MKNRNFLFILLFLFFIQIYLYAETLILLGGQELKAEIVGFENNHFELKTSYGKIKIHKELIYNIIINESGKLKNIDTPQKSFDRWLSAAEKGDIESIIACYSEKLKGLKRDELQKLDAKTLKKMAKRVNDTKFTTSNLGIFGSKATLKIESNYESTQDIAFLEFVYENGLWKIDE